MHIEMDLELINFITWKNVKKGHRSMTRQPRKAGLKSFGLGVQSHNKLEDMSVSGSKKSGIIVLGQHFSVKVVDAPKKKRRVLHQSPSRPPRAPSLDDKGALSPQPQTPSPHHEESGKRVGRKYASGRWCRSNSLSNSRKTKSKDGMINGDLLKMQKQEDFDLDDFSGIELLAAAACSSSIGYSADHVEEAFVEEEHTTQRVDSYTVCIKGTIASIESANSSAPDSTIPVTQLMPNNGNYSEEKGLAPSKGSSLPWDLNTVMDQCEEPCRDSLVDPHFQKTYEQIEYETSSREVMDISICKTSNGESSTSKSNVADSLIPPAKSDLSTSTMSVLQAQAIVKGESDTMCDLAVQFETKNRMLKSDMQPVSEVVVQGECESPKLCKSVGDNKLASEDPLRDCCGSNVSQHEKGHMLEGNTMDRVQAGYDSPFEDGELREPIGYAWEENQVEGRYYESDNIYEEDFNTTEYHMSQTNKVSRVHGQEVENESSLLKEGEEKFKKSVPNSEIEQCAKGATFKKPHFPLGFKASGYQLQENSEYVILDASDCGFEKFPPERKIGHDESRTLQGKLYIDRSASFEVDRSGFCLWQSRSGKFGDSYSRAERGLGTEKSVGRHRISSHGSGHRDVSGQWVESSVGTWDLRSSYTSHRAKSFGEDPAMRPGGSSDVKSNQSRNYNQREICRISNRRPSPMNRNNSYGVHRGLLQVKGLTHDRCRGGTGFHPEGSRRAPQEDYHDRKPCFLEQKGRCYSPNSNRGAHLSRSWRQSWSRSRSGSPIAWHFQNGKSVDTRRQSLDYRSVAKFNGKRFAYHKPRFSGDFEASFVSSIRGHVSPQRSSRCFDDQFRGKRQSPLRSFRQNQRFKSDDHIQLSQRSGR